MDPDADLFWANLREILPENLPFHGQVFIGLAIHRAVNNEVQILLVKRHEGHFQGETWEIPSGQLRAHHLDVADAIPEISRELIGLEVESVGEGLWTIVWKRDFPYLILQINFQVECVGTYGPLRLYPADYTEAAWVTQRDLEAGAYTLRGLTQTEHLIQQSFEARARSVANMNCWLTGPTEDRGIADDETIATTSDEEEI